MILDEAGHRVITLTILKPKNLPFFFLHVIISFQQQNTKNLIHLLIWVWKQRP